MYICTSSNQHWSLLPTGVQAISTWNQTPKLKQKKAKADIFVPKNFPTMGAGRPELPISWILSPQNTTQTNSSRNFDSALYDVMKYLCISSISIANNLKHRKTITSGETM